ncbi:hypothetical protein FB107DRAFT_224555 [Schizophyllum commune]
MTTPGEQHFYTVALMDALMKHLPRGWVVGLLYDIACQIHLSAVKHGYFGQYLDRLRFAVSVFHAFGHDWPCQLVYHPRKCLGFGLTDGEGCERFWYSISKLIPYLRVAGYHLRKYTLNAQFAFATKDAIIGLGTWLNRKASLLAEKRKEAYTLLREAGDVGKDEDFIRKQWKAQSLGRQEMTKALQLHEEMERAAGECERLRANTEEADEEHVAALRSAEANHVAAKAKYNRKLAQLGVPARAQLQKLINDTLLHRRANALVLLRRVLNSILKRKMEVERVVRSHRSKNGEEKIRKHVSTATNRREGTVKAIVSRYNKACADLLRLIKRRRSQRGACTVRPLTPLPKTGFWDLGIDNPCWDDLRFDSADTEAPPWMANDNVRMAIRGRLLLDRCIEEEARLAHERANAMQWYEEEWLALCAALRAAPSVPDAPALLHQLRERQRVHLRIAVQWEHRGVAVRGPTEAQLKAAQADWAAASCDAGLPRVTRSGAAFSNIVVLPNEVDLEQLFRDADQHRAEHADELSIAESVLTSLPDSRAPSPLSDLTDLEESDDNADAPVLEGPSNRATARTLHPAAGDHASSAQAKNSKVCKSQKQRKRKRQELGNNSEASKRHRADLILQASQERATYNFNAAPVTSTGFTCLRNAWEAGIPELEDLVGYKILDWDGVGNGAITVNREQVVMVMLVGCGKGKGRTDHNRVARMIRDVGDRIPFSADEQDHRRGLFGVKAIGISHGGGQKQPGPLKHSDKTRKELMRIVKLQPMQRIAHVNSGAFQNWQPDSYDHYADTKKKLIDWKPRLRRFFNFPKSVWSCLTINFGPRTVCTAHRDFNNLSHGFCAITALGSFNPDRGGHLILRELKLVIRFPPGSSIILPSALITHHNTDVGPDETRYSVTQYTSGAIFRFVEHGLQLDEDYYGSLNTAELREARKANSSRWAKGVAMLSRLPKLRRDTEAVKAGEASGVDL